MKNYIVLSMLFFNLLLKKDSLFQQKIYKIQSKFLI